jgi:hypothetical protein
MAGNKGLQAFVKQLAPEAMWEHFELVAINEACP